MKSFGIPELDEAIRAACGDPLAIVRHCHRGYRCGVAGQECQLLACFGIPDASRTSRPGRDNSIPAQANGGSRSFREFGRSLVEGRSYGIAAGCVPGSGTKLAIRSKSPAE